jgi:hypothetical protein
MTGSTSFFKKCECNERKLEYKKKEILTHVVIAFDIIAKKNNKLAVW